MEPLENSDVEIEIDEVPGSPDWSGLGVRAASSAVLAGVFALLLWQGGWFFTWFVLLAALMMMREWTALTDEDGPLWRFAGLFYVTIPCASLIWLRDVRFENMPDAGMRLILFLMIVVVATDVGAYFAGRKIGGPKLAPVISPNKTWAGLAGGVIAASVAGGLCHSFSPYPVSLGVAIVLGGVFAALAQAGDLFESWMKRRVGVKDSGTLIPGHGGLLDRIDGLIPTLPLFAWLVFFSGLTA